MNFLEKIRDASVKSGSFVCVGLDTDPRKIPPHLEGTPEGVLRFNKAVIDATKDIVCAYKPNSAFYEAMGPEGMQLLIETCNHIPADIPVILDIKRGDIGNTAEKYADFAYDIIGADAVTINPYMGYDAVEPFMREDRCPFVLCLTSNRSSQDFQFVVNDGKHLFETVAEKIREWSSKGELGVVAGATQEEHLGRIRSIVGAMPLLVPGIGAQGGDSRTVIKECGGMPGLTIINSSRVIIYASGGEDFAEKARSKTLELRDELNSCRGEE